MNTLRAVSLLAATLTMGLITGAFALYAHSIMPGLKTTDDRTFVTAFAAMDRAIINPWFMLTAFLGALVFTVAATLVNLGEDAFPFAVAALVAYGVVFVITMVVNVPLNDALKAATGSDFTAIRERFQEGRWVAWNLVRTFLSGGAFVALSWALLVHDRT
ncbi:DUF1772 domain-containing protein [Solirubrobacter sp. CPCC 204708]|uniref:DUF1772 domain-containing protein n=1 Tax=Solirubrobacter deserti TaxID=2282478 RepID=A0ABT4RTG6_9ACTN|nr:DUF1772 domain-containing protein [Solirubrobacter deserti]MBE2315667.1 DUF1772 domain-containing protein [Solirubrobacter deserti]MDA0141755.1 DUF1772 domain-containing protein [Solirubrobacter deserti]